MFSKYSPRLNASLRSFQVRSAPISSIRASQRNRLPGILQRTITSVAADNSQYGKKNDLPLLSNFWAPTQRAVSHSGESNPGHDLLVRAGFLRQAHSGIFHLLPLGLRVQEKVERLIDRHMRAIGASKVSLSSLSSEKLWQRSGRLDKSRSSELLRLQDRKGVKYLLSPTHEEEITSIIADAVHSYKELPLRLYQVSRKYRDEPRPRQGLLRGREFVMKDLYTFDADPESARATYNQVRAAYHDFFQALRMPFLTAKADSGNMGGTLSHEYHFATPNGEDTIIQCEACNLSINEELYVGIYDGDTVDGDVSVEYYVSKDRTFLCKIHYPSAAGDPNIYAVKAIFPDIDSSLQGEQALKEYQQSGSDRTISFVDPRIPSHNHPADSTPSESDQRPIVLTKAQSDSPCPSCLKKTLEFHRATELGHTFYLGTRYSAPLEANIVTPNNTSIPIEMGCHGIGVSRLIGACASLLADSKGLNWPLALAPFEVVLVPGPETSAQALAQVHSRLREGRAGEGTQPWDVVVDDRERPIGWKLKDADLVGYPFIVVIGRAWERGKMVEVQCRRLGVKMEVGIESDDFNEVLFRMSEKL